MLAHDGFDDKELSAGAGGVGVALASFLASCRFASRSANNFDTPFTRTFQRRSFSSHEEITPAQPLSSVRDCNPTSTTCCPGASCGATLAGERTVKGLVLRGDGFSIMGYKKQTRAGHQESQGEREGKPRRVGGEAQPPKLLGMPYAAVPWLTRTWQER